MDYLEFKKTIIGKAPPVSQEKFLEINRKPYDKFPAGDIRRQWFPTAEDYCEFLYNKFITDVDSLLEPFFYSRIKSDRHCITNYGFIEIKENSLVGVRDNPKYQREAFWGPMSRCTTMGVDSLTSIFTNIFSGKLEPRITYPSVIGVLRYPDEKRIFIDSYFRHIAALPSIYSPVTYRTLLKWQHQYMGKPPTSLLCPTASWGSPILACRPLEYEKIVLIDVQCDVLDICRNKVFVDAYSNSSFFDTEPKLETHCVPSENMQAALKGEKFDHIFFCPPYYDLEHYAGEEQSTEKYKTYQEWLDGYWRGTVISSIDSMHHDTVFSFTVNDYYDGNYLLNDMVEYCQILGLVEIDRIRIDRNLTSNNHEVRDRNEYCIAMKLKG